MSEGNIDKSYWVGTFEEWLANQEESSHGTKQANKVRHNLDKIRTTKLHRTNSLPLGEWQEREYEQHSLLSEDAEDGLIGPTAARPAESSCSKLVFKLSFVTVLIILGGLSLWILYKTHR